MPLVLKSKPIFYTLVFLALVFLSYSTKTNSDSRLVEPVEACIIPDKLARTEQEYQQIAACLNWVSDESALLCGGYYQFSPIKPIDDPNALALEADRVDFADTNRSVLTGNVEIAQKNRIVTAETAYVYRDPHTKAVTRIELLGQVRFKEPGRLLVAKKVTINPVDKSGVIENALYEFITPRYGAILPATGQALFIRRFPNEDYSLEQATYTTCAPNNRSWMLKARSIKLDKAEGRGVARDTTLYLKDIPVLYAPYLSFPTTKKRKTGFLMPMGGYSSVGGFDLALPFYWNLRPNYDATLIPHLYSRRGLMMEGEFRYLTPQSVGTFYGSFLSHDRAFAKFINNYWDNLIFIPNSTDRYAIRLDDTTELAPNLGMSISFERVSDDYYFQDFTNAIALTTQRQLLEQALVYLTLDNWFFQGMFQAFQTLNPFNETPISPIYRRLPQLLAESHYENLVFNSSFDLIAQFDEYKWDSLLIPMPEGPRLYVNPTLSLPFESEFGYMKPRIELISRHYSIDSPFFDRTRSFSPSILRFSLEGGLRFERFFSSFNYPIRQTFEPRIYYLRTPYKNQADIPVFDSAYMIFNYDQVFRPNRFSGYDRIGDANQLGYGFITRFISELDGNEFANFSIGQIGYFSDRKVFLCQSPLGYCPENPLTLGFLSPSSKFSPIASRLFYKINNHLLFNADYVFDPAIGSTNNANFNLHYQSASNKTLTLGYNYLVNGDIILVANAFNPGPLNQASIGFSWPLTERITSLGAYGHNLSKGYEMAAFLGLQYESCCFATRFLVGRTFKGLDINAHPEYINGVYLQILLKGLGTVENRNPQAILDSYIPGFVGGF